MSMSLLKSSVYNIGFHFHRFKLQSKGNRNGGKPILSIREDVAFKLLKGINFEKGIENFFIELYS